MEKGKWMGNDSGDFLNTRERKKGSWYFLGIQSNVPIKVHKKAMSEVQNQNNYKFWYNGTKLVSFLRKLAIYKNRKKNVNK